MPKSDDVKKLEDKIKSIGKEDTITEEVNKTETKSADEELLDALPEEQSIENIADEIRKDLKSSQETSDLNEILNIPSKEKSPFDEDFLNEISLNPEESQTEEELNLDFSTGTQDKVSNKIQTDLNLDFLTEEQNEQELNDIQEKVSEKDSQIEIDQEQSDIDSLLAGLSEEQQTENKLTPEDASFNMNLEEDKLENIEEEPNVDSIYQTEELSNLTNIHTNDSGKKDEVDTLLKEMGQELPSHEDIDFKTDSESQEKFSLPNEAEEELSLLKEGLPETEDKTEEPDYILEKRSEELDENSLHESLDSLLETPLESLTEDKILNEETETKKGDELFLHEEIPDVSLKTEKAEEELSDISNFELESFETIPSLDTFDEEKSEKPLSTKKPSPSIEFADGSIGAIPKELSKEDVKHDQDISIKLTDNERKQIILTLTNLPKEAELKIAKAIISNKYTNAQLKPLIDSLINVESPATIIKYYEKITGDRSLSRAEIIRRFKGQQFEELQKSAGYLIQKNLVPILIRVLLSLLVILSFFVITVRLIMPTVYATVEYKNGLKQIEEKNFEKGEEHFQNAFNTQPRFNEVIKYARKYKENKRILEAEKKYDHALSWKPYRKDIVLEYADFLREIGSFERSEKKYRSLLSLNEKDIDALVGLGKTYYDWSNEDIKKLEDAENTFKEVLSINNKNKEALFGNLKVYIRTKNHKKIMAQYSYITKKVKGKGDPQAYALLAEYLVNRNDFDKIKEVLKKAYDSVGKNEQFPEIDYQNARYKKALNIFDEERLHLLSAIRSFEIMKKTNQAKYESKNYQTLLARVYNDMGENIERKERASLDAEMYYNKAIQADPDYSVAYYNLGNFSFNFKPNGYEEAKKFYELAEEKGFKNDRLYYNLAKIYYSENDYYTAFLKLNRVMEKLEYNPTILFMMGTVYYKLNNYDLSESMLLQSYTTVSNEINRRGSFLNLDNPDDRQMVDTLKQICNNLGATYQKKFEKTRRNSFLVRANSYYSEAMLLSSRLNDTKAREKSHINLRMVLFPYSGVEDPYIYDDFPDKFTKN